MGLIDEFKTFVRRGNVMDLAVGIIIGAAFGKIVSSLVADLLMPPIGYILGNVDFKDLAITIRGARLNPDGSVADPPIVLGYGKFIQTIIDFVIIAFCVFLLVKVINRLQGPPPPDPPKPPPEEVKLLTEIRDLLKDRSVPNPGPIP
jgi:large conductance mechanosensitive channel